jgi:GNAT superfamily N-acetyltransferase
MEVAHVHVRSWQAAYRGLLPDHVLDGLRPEDRAARYTFGSADPAQPATLVAVVGGAIGGFATTVPAGDEEAPGTGQVGALYVDPVFWGDGVGRALIEAARGELVAAGFAQAVLWVLFGNERAIRFYERDGWRADGAVRREVVWGVPVDEVRYRRRLSSEPEPAAR